MIFLDSAAFRRDLAQADTDFAAAVRQSLGQAVAYAEQLAKSTTKWNNRTGKARSSIKRGQRSTWAHFVQAGGGSAFYVKFLEDGTKAHEIRPKLGGDFIGPARPGQGRRRGRAVPVLRFQVNGRWVSARKVKHPGTTGTKFMQDARDQAESRLAVFLQSGLNRVFG